MEKTPEHKPKIPLTEKLKTIPDVLGIRLNEQPDYDVLVKDGDIEVRKYHKTLLAQVTVQGEYEQAIKDGFQILANYIFGENKTDDQIAMTAPVYQEKTSEGWMISFVVPEKFDRNTVPDPVNPNIHFVDLPERKIAVLKYSGNNNQEKMKKAEQELSDWIATSGSRASSNIRWAQYDPPFAVPFLKRNEAQVNIN